MRESRFSIKISYTSSDIARTMCNSVASEYIFIATLSILQGESMDTLETCLLGSIGVF